MRIALLVTTAVLLGACASAPDDTLCTDPRPQVCTMQYDPACGLLKNGESKTYSSPCNACADDQVVSRELGACPE
ncbi:MAG: hypothetical protein AB8C02_12290 [Halioglobus sp.]